MGFSFGQWLHAYVARASELGQSGFLKELRNNYILAIWRRKGFSFSAVVGLYNYKP